jgi:hypothetical protein
MFEVMTANRPIQISLREQATPYREVYGVTADLFVWPGWPNTSEVCLEVVADLVTRVYNGDSQIELRGVR